MTAPDWCGKLIYMSYELTTDTRVPGIPDDDFRFDFPIRESYLGDAWREGYAACLRDMDAGKFDRPSADDILKAADYGFKVERLNCGFGDVAGKWVVVGFNGEQYGPVLDSRNEAYVEAVSRWREDTRHP